MAAGVHSISRLPFLSLPTNINIEFVLSIYLQQLITVQGTQNRKLEQELKAYRCR